jgi:SAM-dependent methyltransferase
MADVLPDERILAAKDPCDLCGGTDRELIATLDRHDQPLDTGICRRCGMVAQWHRLTEGELLAFYAGEYRQSYHGEIAPSPRRVRRAWVNGERIFSQLKPFVGSRDSVFEVGAGIGCTVKAFELSGYRASGIDPGEGFQKFSYEQLRAHVHNVSLFDLPPQPKHDLILLVHAIEHFRSPRRALEHIHRLLQPGGMLYVECPNIAAPFAIRPKLFHFAHITNFTPSSLTMLAESCGFRVLQSFSREHDPNIEVLLERTDSARIDIDEKNYSRTLAAIERYNALTYHLRPTYFISRIAKLASYATEYLIGPWWLNRFTRRCQAEKPLATTPAAPIESAQRRAT